MILEAFYSSSSVPAPIEFPDTVSYVWLGQAFLGLFPWNMDKDVIAMIDDGSVAYELLRPVDLYFIWYIRTLAWRIASTLLRCVPLLLVTTIILPLIGLDEWALRLPGNVETAALWLLSMLLAVVLGAAMTTLSHASLMWTISGQGFTTLLGPIVMFASGMIVPIPLLPGWAQSILRFLPFHGLIDTPFRIYSQHIAGSETLLVLLLQLIWIVAVVEIGRHLVRRGTRRLVVQGG
jgi:ABC-2 type transport system permease protein